MHTRRRAAVIALALAVATAAGCSKRARVGELNMSPEVQINVVNNMNPPSSFTLFVLDQSGQRQLIGEVGTTQSQTLHYRPLSSTAQFRLVAHITGRGDLLSPAFTLSDVAGVTWDVQHNLITIEDVP